jgi:1-acyl-sn-glycerol-3-phosphate acyltransferase
VLYALLLGIAGIALRWFYRRIDVEGLERLPRRGPLLLVVNHPNALVDAMVVGSAIPRRIVLTAKATLFDNAALARLLDSIGVVPLVRSSDARRQGGSQPVDPRRNARAFDALRAVLRRGGTVLIFPEGISHDAPSLAPLRTGAARIALDARGEGGVRGLHVVPIGLTFERKEAPRSRVLVKVGEPIALDDWPDDGDGAVAKLTAEIDSRLRAVTLNYDTTDDARRARALATILASSLREGPEPLGSVPSLHVEFSLEQRIERARSALDRTNDDELRRRADNLARALADLQDSLSRHRVSLDDVDVSPAGHHAAPFALREGWIIALGGPVALWGAINHWIPFHAARMIARRSVESAADPAMRTILAGTALVLAFYAVQGALVAFFVGRLAALLYIASLPLTADVNLILRERLRGALRRARTYFLFRGRPKLRERLQLALQQLRTEAVEIERRLQETGITAQV